MDNNIWLCGDYEYQKHSNPVVLPRLHPSRAKNLGDYARASTMSFLAEHVLRSAHQEVQYIAWQWVSWCGQYHAYITFSLKNSEHLLHPYMGLMGVSDTDWLHKRLLIFDSNRIAQHDPAQRQGNDRLWSNQRTLAGIL